MIPLTTLKLAFAFHENVTKGNLIFCRLYTHICNEVLGIKIINNMGRLDEKLGSSAVSRFDLVSKTLLKKTYMQYVCIFYTFLNKFSFLNNIVYWKI